MRRDVPPGEPHPFLYARLARALLDAPKETKVTIVDELEEKYAERFPDLVEFVGAFTDLSYSDEFTQQKRIVQYVLKRIFGDSCSSGGDSELVGGLPVAPSVPARGIKRQGCRAVESG